MSGVRRWASFIVAVIGAARILGAQELWQAAGMGDVTAMQRALTAGASVSALDERGLSPIQVAAIYGSREATLWLMDHGADVNFRGRCDSPLSLACANGHIELAREILKRGGKYHRHDEGLRQAVLAGHSECAQLLLEQGARLGPVTARELVNGVLKAGHVESLILLRQAQRKWQKLEQGTGQEREEKLLRAAHAGDVAQVRSLLASPGSVGDFGMLAALVLARQQGELDVVEALRGPAAKALAEAEHRRKLSGGSATILPGGVIARWDSGGAAVWG